MNRQRAFSLIELLVVIGIIAVLIGLLFPAIGAAKRVALRAENGTKVRSVIQAMITASESRRGFFPGFDGFEFTADGTLTTGDSGPGYNVQARYWILLDGGYMDGAAAISPSENKEAWRTGEVTTENYSFAMLKLASQGNLDPASRRNKVDRFRREEWRNEQNALAPVVSDRLLVGPGDTVQGASQPETYASIHDGSSLGRWIGTVGFGDLSVEFFDEPIMPTRIAGFANEEDDIFAFRDTVDDTSNANDSNKNASMVYEDFNITTGATQ